MNDNLTLIFKKVWFDQILKGTKKEEYRNLSKYYFQRLLSNWYENLPPKEYEFRNYKTLTCLNGYRKNRPEFLIEIKAIDIGKGNPKWTSSPEKEVFRIKLGKVISRKNC